MARRESLKIRNKTDIITNLFSCSTFEKKKNSTNIGQQKIIWNIVLHTISVLYYLMFFFCGRSNELNIFSDDVEKHIVFSYTSICKKFGFHIQDLRSWFVNLSLIKKHFWSKFQCTYSYVLLVPDLYNKKPRASEFIWTFLKTFKFYLTSKIDFYRVNGCI